VSFSSGSEVLHIFTRKSHVRPKEILVMSAKRLFQQHRSIQAFEPERWNGPVLPLSNFAQTQYGYKGRTSATLLPDAEASLSDDRTHPQQDNRLQQTLSVEGGRSTAAGRRLSGRHGRRAH